MKNIFTVLVLGLGLASMIGCQQVTPAEPFTTEEPTGDSGLELCPDGTLNCYVEFPANTTTVNDLNFDQSYTSCMDECLPSNCTDGGDDIIEEAAEECPVQFVSCDVECNMVSEDSTISGLPDSEGVTLPENPKAVLVEITGWYTLGMINEIHFQGPEIHYVTPVEGRRKVIKSGSGLFGIGGARNVEIGHGVGRNPHCAAVGLKNQVKVTYKPQSGSSVTIGSQNISIVPFSNTAVVEKKRPIPHSMGFGIPASVREEVDLSEIVWIPVSFALPSPLLETEMINDWRFYNSDIPYGRSVVITGVKRSPLIDFTSQKISVYGFFKSKD